ncbi:MAG: FeoB-associated Cys-rich membrane protein [Clostridiales bacterium]|nr:FeoB-associated Cys-rich membrane protein [Clostridiales bacterium]
MEWLKNNIGTIAVSLILAAIVILIIVKMIRDKKKGKASCGCGCANCAMSATCHSPSKKEE